MEKKERRPRRTNIALEKDIMNAVKELIEEVGFGKLTLTRVASRARIEPNVFYKRFEDMSALFDVFTKKYDYWITEVLPYDNGSVDGEKYETILLGIGKSLYRNKVVQRLLTWELAEDNTITRRTSKLREAYIQQFIHQAGERYSSDQLQELAAVTAVLMGGMYYCILHKERSSFSGIDFNRKNGKEILFSTISTLFQAWMKEKRNEERITGMVERMRASGIPEEQIAFIVENRKPEWERA